MSTPRNALADRLAAGLPTSVRVVPYARNIDAPKRPTVMARVDEVLPHEQAPTTHRLYRFTAILIASKVAPDGPADDELDALLQLVLDAVDDDDTMAWTRATRATWLDTTLPAYEVAVEVTHKKVSTP